MKKVKFTNCLKNKIGNIYGNFDIKIVFCDQFYPFGANIKKILDFQTEKL